MNNSIQTELKTTYECIGQLLVFLEAGEPGAEDLRKVRLALRSYSYDLRAIAERLRYQGAAGER